MTATALVLAAAISILAATSAQADAPRLALPIDCTLGETCYIQNYVDRAAGEAAADFTCAGLTYNGHKGTDIGLPSLAAMDAGVNVLAAAPGLVIGIRDGMRDVLYTAENASEINGRDCGNGVVIRHGDGWDTQYCHMRQGSIAVQKGMQITARTVLGQVGLSGRTQFPHAHLSVRHNGQVIDPFDTSATATCALDDNTSLWQVTPAYVAGGLLSAGFSPAVPSYDAVKSGTADMRDFTQETPAMVFWGLAFGGKTGDQLQIRITGPTGAIVDQTSEITRNRAQFFRAAGKKRPRASWPKGAYTGTVILLRDNAEIDRMESTITVE